MGMSHGFCVQATYWLT